MKKVSELNDFQLRNKALFLKWLIFAVIVIAVVVSAFVYMYTNSLKIAAVIPIILIPAVNLPVSLKLIRLDEERRRRIEKYEQLYTVASRESDMHLMN